jgi:hypothetical protein
MTTRAAPQLEILALRSIELTDPVAAGELPFIETVGMPYDAAIVAGVVVMSATRSYRRPSPRPSPMRGRRHDEIAAIPA